MVDSELNVRASTWSGSGGFDIWVELAAKNKSHGYQILFYFIETQQAIKIIITTK